MGHVKARMHIGEAKLDTYLNVGYQFYPQEA